MQRQGISGLGKTKVNLTRVGLLNRILYFRLTSLTDGVDSLTQYTNGLSEEQDFVAETQGKIQSQPPLSPNLDEVKKMVQPTLVRKIIMYTHELLYNTIHHTTVLDITQFKEETQKCCIQTKMY